jgi:sugar lactone lactonase YvrE
MHHVPTARLRRGAALLAATACAAALALPSGPAVAAHHASCHTAVAPTTLASGLGTTFGSDVGPDGALYVADGAGGRILRVDPRTGATSTFVDGLPTQVVPGLGGPMDVSFVDGTAYVLVSLVGADVGGTHVTGIYRVDGPHAATVVANIGAFTIAHPPATDYFVPEGLQFAMLPWHGGFLVTDGHHNRVYRVGLDGSVGVAEAFDDIVPTGIMRWGNRILMTEAGPTPHLPATGRLVQLDLASGGAAVLSTGTRLAVDAARFGSTLYTLSQGVFPLDGDAGSPANPGTGGVMRVASDGSVSQVVGSLDRPTSMQVIGHTAYVVTLGGSVVAVDLR